jgi:hypothetical protein
VVEIVGSSQASYDSKELARGKEEEDGTTTEREGLCVLVRDEEESKPITLSTRVSIKSRL